MTLAEHNEIAEALANGQTYESLFQYDQLPQSPTHYRLCYHRAGLNWRLRDERTGQLWLVKEYRGPASINWTDGGTHIFCDGYARVDEDGVAWLSEEPFD